MGLKNIFGNVGEFLKRPIETRTEETIDTKTDYYQHSENLIKQQIVALLNREGTQVHWQSGRDNVIIRNKNINTKYLITKTKQRVLWQTDTNMDTLPTTITFIEKLIKIISDREDELFKLLTDDILTQRTSRMESMSTTIEAIKEIQLSEML